MNSSFSFHKNIAPALAISFYLFVQCAAGTPIVWIGPTTSFTKLSTADPSLPANQDHLTAPVVLTRGATQGIYNLVEEEQFDRFDFTSPSGTLWATSVNNPGLQITASNWA